MQQPGRNFTKGNGYRYSINGQEKTPEVAPNTTTAEFWQYDARIAKRWNMDVKPNVSLSPYNCFGGNPIWMADPLGDTLINGQKMEGRNAASATYLQEAVVTAKKKYVPEQDFMHNQMTGYNSNAGPGFEISNTASTKSLLWEFVNNWQCNSGKCRNTIIVGGPLLEEVKDLKSVQKLFREGVNNLYGEDKKFTPGSYFKGRYIMSDLNGPDGVRMKNEVIEDILDGKSLSDSRILSAEFFLGSYGFSMRITNDGKYMAITVYDSKTIQSATDAGKSMLKQLSPIDERTAPTYQRYFWVIPVEKVIDKYKESIISTYKSR